MNVSRRTVLVGVLVVCGTASLAFGLWLLHGGLGYRTSRVLAGGTTHHITLEGGDWSFYELFPETGKPRTDLRVTGADGRGRDVGSGDHTGPTIQGEPTRVLGELSLRDDEPVDVAIGGDPDVRVVVAQRESRLHQQVVAGFLFGFQGICGLLVALAVVGSALRRRRPTTATIEATPRERRRPIVVVPAVIGLVVAIIVTIVAAQLGSPGVSHSPGVYAHHQVPASFEVSLEPGQHVVYVLEAPREATGTVKVVGPGGTSPVVRSGVSHREFGSKGWYLGAACFRVTAAGTYTVRVSDVAPTSAYVGPVRSGPTFRVAVSWLLGGVAGLLYLLSVPALLGGLVVWSWRALRRLGRRSSPAPAS